MDNNQSTRQCEDVNSTTIDLNRLEVFRAVATSASITSAAERLGLDKGRVSRVVAALEQSLGAPLLARTTRAMRLTPEGAALLERIAGPLDSLKAATQLPRSTAFEGQVTLATSPEIARVFLPAALTSFRLRYPRVRLVLRASADLEDLGDVDLALRVGRKAPAAWVSTRVRELESGFFAAPGYLERRGEPRGPEDLPHHEGLWPTPPRGTRAFSTDGLRPIQPSVSCSDFSVLATLCLASAGVALLPTFLVGAEVAAGLLVRVMPAVTLGGAPLMLISRPPGQLAPRVRELRAHLRSTFASLE